MEKVPEDVSQAFFCAFKCFVIALNGIIGFLQIIIQNYDV